MSKTDTRLHLYCFVRLFGDATKKKKKSNSRPDRVSSYCYDGTAWVSPGLIKSLMILWFFFFPPPYNWPTNSETRTRTATDCLAINVHNNYYRCPKRFAPGVVRTSYPRPRVFGLPFPSDVTRPINYYSLRPTSIVTVSILRIIIILRRYFYRRAARTVRKTKPVRDGFFFFFVLF